MSDVREILFLIPYRLTRPYFSSLYSECEYRIYALPNLILRVVWRCVTRETDEFDAAKVVEILERELTHSDRISLLVVTPTADRALTEGIAKTAKERNFPIIALSLPFQDSKPFDGRLPPTVHCNSKSGGTQLARAAGADFRSRWPHVKNPQVVLIPGELNRTDSDERLVEFESGLRAAGFFPEETRLPHCYWQRDQARTAMLDYIKNAREKIHIVFAANDEMALGARDAVRLTFSELSARCLIYGYDAVSEVTSLIDQHDQNMRGTVEQDIVKMASELAAMIPRVLDPTNNTRLDDVLIEPKLRVRPKTPDDKRPLPDLVAWLLESPRETVSWWTTRQAETSEGLKPGSIKKAKQKQMKANIKQVSEPLHHDGTDVYGRDASGRVWRKKNGALHYWKGSLKPRNGQARGTEVD